MYYSKKLLDKRPSAVKLSIDTPTHLLIVRNSNRTAATSNYTPSVKTFQFFYDSQIVPIIKDSKKRISFGARPQKPALANVLLSKGKLIIKGTALMDEELEFDIFIDSTNIRPVTLKSVELKLSIDDGTTWFAPDSLVIGSNKIEIETLLPKSDIEPETLCTQLVAETTDGFILFETVEHAFILKHL